MVSFIEVVEAREELDWGGGIKAGVKTQSWPFEVKIHSRYQYGGVTCPADLIL